MSVAAVTNFPAQATTGILSQDVFYALGTMGLLLVAVSFGFIDSGLVRRKNLLDTWLQKLLAALIAGTAFLFIGYAIWQWQFDTAFGIPNPLSTAIKSWWIGGTAMTHFASDLNPKVYPTADVYQVFAVFFVTYGAALGAILHSAGVERMKPLPLYIAVALVGGIVMPVVEYLTWGPVSPLTNRGLHDFNGTFSFYIFVGVISVFMSWRLGPRLGAFKLDRRTEGPKPHNMGLVAAGVGLLLFAIPFAILGCGFYFNGFGYTGIAMNRSGIGITFINIFASYGGGALVGAIMAYRLRNPTLALLGPIAGYIGAGCCLDLGYPWQIFLISAGGPIAFYGAYKLIKKLGIDDPKVGPLTLGPGIYSAVITGIVYWGTKQGGYVGLTGKYAPDHAGITLGWELIGVGVAVAGGLVIGLVIFIMEKTIGIRVKEDAEIMGLDATYWDAAPEHDDEMALPVADRFEKTGAGV